MKNIAKFIILFIFIIALVSSLVCCTSFNDHTYTITVTEKERVTYAESSKYLIYSTTSDGETKVFEKKEN